MDINSNIQLVTEINRLKADVASLKNILTNHQHVLGDSTSPIKKSIILDDGQWFAVGQAQILARNLIKGGSPDTDQYQVNIAVGDDPVTDIGTYKSKDLQMNLIHYPSNTSLFSYLTCLRNPSVANYENITISVSSGSSTITIPGYNFVTNELVGGYINIYNSSANLVETQKISSNTSTTITITGTWINSTSGGKFLIYTPVFLGKTDTIFRRLYVEEESATGGVRFGVGATSNGQNGLLYMDTAGDLQWRNKAGTVTKLN